MKTKNKIRIIHCSDDAKRHSSPWMVRYYRDRKPVREYFATKALAEVRAREIGKLINQGLDPAKMRAVNRLIAGTGYDACDLIEMALRGLQKKGAAALSPMALFRDATALVIKKADGDKSLSEGTRRNYRNYYKHINHKFGDRTAVSITAPEVEAFLAELPNAQRVPRAASEPTKRTYAVMFKMALKALGLSQPLSELPAYHDLQHEVKFFSVEQVRLMFEVTPARNRGQLALALFGVMRPLLLEKLPADCVDVDARTISIPAYMAKDRHGHLLEGEIVRPDNSRIIPGLPEVLWIWLKAFPFKPACWLNIQLHLKATLGFWIQDGLRHTGATYYHRLYGQGATAALLTHEGMDLVLKHYVGITSRLEADAFFALIPSSIAFRVERAPYGNVHDIPRAELERLVWTKNMKELAAELNCSVSGLFKHCQMLNIPRPNTGYWTMLRHRAQNDPDRQGYAAA